MKNNQLINTFIGYEYKDLIVSKSMEGLYADAYQNFGWILDNISDSITGSTTSMRFKRDRKIRNKAELTRLQRQFDDCISKIIKMEHNKRFSATMKSITIGIGGTAFMAGATFSYLGGYIWLCIILAIPGFLGWIFPYFFFKSSYAKNAQQIEPLIESEYDEIYKITERANSLLGN